MARTLTVTARLLGLLLAAIVVVSSCSAVAAALPARCPANTHELGWGESPCISDQRHMAPSGAGSIPYFSTGKDARLPLRIEIAGAGLLLGGLLLVAAFWTQKPSSPVTAALEIAAV